MCRCCCCCWMEGHHHHGHKPMHHGGMPWPIMDVEEEIKMLEEYKEALKR
ncbi:MAG: hypothetical protein QXF75_07620 [Candidatus Bathyarchaeia archaeon]